VEDFLKGAAFAFGHTSGHPYLNMAWNSGWLQKLHQTVLDMFPNDTNNCYFGPIAFQALI
jgi:hypothetical protein